MNEKYLDEEGLIDKLNSLDKQKGVSLNKLEKERLEDIARILRIKPGEIDKLSELSKKELKEAEEKIEQNEYSKDNNILIKENPKNIASKTEIDINQKVTDRDTIGSLLNIQGKGYEKIYVVYSKKLQENTNTTTFSFVGIKQDGSAEEIDGLEQTGGINPNKKVYKLNNDGSKIEEMQMNSIYRIKGKSESHLAIKIGEMGNIETSLIRSPKYDNKEAIGIPIQNKYNMNPTTREIREFMNDQKNPRMNEEIDRLEEHKKNDCENITIKDINDDQNDNTHIHSTTDIDYLNQLASKILENDEIAKVYNRQDVVNRLKNDIEPREQKGIHTDIEKIMENVEKRLEIDAR